MKLICYLSNGYPSIDASIKMAHEYTQAGCDIIEVDFPSHDPYLESELIAGRMAAALSENDNYDDYMKGILEIKAQNPDTHLIVLAYENTIMKIGVGKYAKFLTENGFHDAIYVGNEHPEVLNELISLGIKVSCYVQFHQPQDEVDAALKSNGFVYVQAKPTTGNINPDYPTLKDTIDHLRSLGITREIYAGVGIYTKDDIAMARDAGADGVFVGSTILKLHDNLSQLRETIREFKAEASK